MNIIKQFSSQQQLHGGVWVFSGLASYCTSIYIKHSQLAGPRGAVGFAFDWRLGGSSGPAHFSVGKNKTKLNKKKKKQHKTTKKKKRLSLSRKSVFRVIGRLQNDLKCVDGDVKPH